MQVDLKKITHVPRRFEQTFAPEWWERAGDKDLVLGLAGPLKASTEIYKAGDRYVLEGSLRGKLRAMCDRCAEAYIRELNVTFRVFLASPPSEGFDEEVSLTPEDLAGDFIVGDTVELDDIVREQIFLAVPMKSLCSDTCRGLCPDCGANLNQGECGCRKSPGRPEFAALKKLKFKGD
jgi:uncharacterized protein